MNAIVARPGFCMVKATSCISLFVAAEARGSGTAAALVADAEALLAANRIETAWLACAIGNDRAARFYVIFFSVITAGILPLVFLGIARSRKRRLRRFFQLGTPALAEIIDFRPEDVAFHVMLTRVRYEFTADGQTRRGSDLTLPVVADRWRAGERIEILYLPGRNYDSMIATRA